ncbi:hypothetical protein [Deinococcus hopiensis]|uniref:hypothetical protein n=1 Tax=Deinococcus hopiensis TaxID=309885 RepID=UPI000A010BEB|nr:hypothetical protein [Deinococcus hopiensis]
MDGGELTALLDGVVPRINDLVRKAASDQTHLGPRAGDPGASRAAASVHQPVPLYLPAQALRILARDLVASTGGVKPRLQKYGPNSLHDLPARARPTGR